MSGFTRRVVDALDAAIVGRRPEIEVVVAALAADRHVLLEGPPGTAKTLLAQTFAASLGLSHRYADHG